MLTLDASIRRAAGNLTDDGGYISMEFAVGFYNAWNQLVNPINCNRLLHGPTAR
jgi:hypothetical protein